MELSAAPTATPLMEAPQSATTPRQAERPQSQSRTVPSREPDSTFLPRSTMAVSRIPGKRKKKRSEDGVGSRGTTRAEKIDLHRWLPSFTNMYWTCATCRTHSSARNRNKQKRVPASQWFKDQLWGRHGKRSFGFNFQWCLEQWFQVFNLALKPIF